MADLFTVDCAVCTACRGGVTKGETIYNTHVKYALKFKDIDYFSSNFCFLADEVLRKVAGD